MTTRPIAGDLATGSEGSTAQQVRDWLAQLTDFTAQLQGGSPAQTAVISEGAITPTSASVYVDTEGAAATDDLDTIVGDVTAWPLGSIIAINSVDEARKPTVKHRTSGSGHIMLRDSADLVLTQQSIRLELQRVSADRWIERQRWYGSQKADARAFLGLGSSATLALATQSDAQAGTSTNTVMTPARAVDLINTAARLITGRAAAGPLGGTEAFVVAQAGALAQVSLGALLAEARKPAWESGLLAVATLVEETHGLGVRPKRVEVELVCHADDLGFSSSVDGGDRFSTFVDDTGNENRTITAGYNEQDVWVALPSVLRLRRRDNPATLGQITPANWRVVFRLYL
jgi:hypothetical protein